MMTINDLTDDLWDAIPHPFLPEHRSWEAAYYHAWAVGDTALRGIDVAEGDYLLWEAGTVALWARYACSTKRLSAFSLLDSFYSRQRGDGALPLAIIGNKPVYTDSDNFKGLATHRNSAAINPYFPLAWPEWDFAQTTGDYSRLEKVIDILGTAFDWETKSFGRDQGYMYWKPPCTHPWHHKDAYGWADYTAMTAIQCEFLSSIGLHLERKQLSESCAANYLGLKELAAERLWDDLKMGYLDVDDDELYISPLSAANSWCMLAGFPNEWQRKELGKHLRNHRTLGRPHPLPTIAPSEKEYKLDGHPLKGSVHPSFVYTMIQALLRLKDFDLAAGLAVRHLEAMALSVEREGAIFEGYHPEYPGKPASKDRLLSPLEVPLGPVATLLEAVFGLRIDGELEEVHYRPALEEDHGLENIKFGGRTLSIYTRWKKNEWSAKLHCDGPAEVYLYGLNGMRVVTFEDADEKTVVFR